MRLVAGTAGSARESPFAEASAGQRAPSIPLTGVLRAAASTLHELSRTPGSTHNRTWAGVSNQASTGPRDNSSSDALTEGRALSGGTTRPSGTYGGGDGGTYGEARYTLESDEDMDDDDVRGRAALDPRPLLGGGRCSSYDSSPSRGPSFGGGRGSDTGAGKRGVPPRLASKGL